MLDVILCAYNAEDTIRQCVDSILDQSFSDFNLFVFDDYSLDNTLSVLKEYNDKRITVVHSCENVGTYSGKNFILKNFCHSDFVALHDSDDFSNINRFEQQIEFLNSYEDIVCLGSAIREFWQDDDVKPHTVSADSVTGNIVRERTNHYPVRINKSYLNEILDTIRDSDDDVIGSFLKVKLCMNGSVMFRRNVLSKLGGWDGRTRIGADTDLFLRILVDHNIGNISNVLYNRKFHKYSLVLSEKYGVNSKVRKEYALNLIQSIQKSIVDGAKIQDFYYPEKDIYKVI